MTPYLSKTLVPTEKNGKIDTFRSYWENMDYRKLLTVNFTVFQSGELLNGVKIECGKEFPYSKNYTEVTVGIAVSLSNDNLIEITVRNKYSENKCRDNDWTGAPINERTVTIRRDQFATLKPYTRK